MSERGTVEEALERGSLTLIEKLQLETKEAVSFADIGCGSGGLARKVAARYPYKVFGFDINKPQMEKADEIALQLEKNRPLFEVKDVNEIDYSKFNVVFARLIFNRLCEPDALIEKIYVDLPKGSYLVVEDMDASEASILPNCPAYEELINIYQRYEAKKGRHPNFGASLSDGLKSQPFCIEYSDSYIPVFEANHPGKDLMLRYFEFLADDFVSEKLAKKEEVEKWLNEFSNHSKSPESKTSLNRIYQVIAKKP